MFALNQLALKAGETSFDCSKARVKVWPNLLRGGWGFGWVGLGWVGGWWVVWVQGVCVVPPPPPSGAELLKGALPTTH